MNKSKARITKLLLLMLFIPWLGTHAELKLPSFFSDNMLLQQQSNANIWGWADAKALITLKTSWSNQTITTRADENGKWNIKLSTPAGSYTTHTMNIRSGKDNIKLTNILIGDVWLCSGQSNMEMPMKGFKGQPIFGGNREILKSKNKNLRLLTIKRNAQLTPQDTTTGSWQEASPETVKEFSATGYYFGRLLSETIENIPIGLMCVSWGGSFIEAWMSEEMLQGFTEKPIPQAGDLIQVPNRTATALFNGMIHPIVGYNIKGCLWYQGETNYDCPDTYPALFQTMVNAWRKLWGCGDFPFYYCQIAPFDYASIAASPAQTGGKYNSAFIREAQYKCQTMVPNTGMVVLLDVGEENCIHPMRKDIVGERLAMLALTKTYGMTGFGAESPSFQEMTVKDGVAILSFTHAPMWLTAFGKELKLFEIAGEDRKFYPAKASINRSKVEVSAQEVKHPVAVRYAFKDFVTGDLFSTEGLPVSSFRTDNWNE